MGLILTYKIVITAIVTVLNRLDHIFSLEEQQTTTLKDFVDKKVVFTDRI